MSPETQVRPKKPGRPQYVGRVVEDRTEHVWLKLNAGSSGGPGWKCVLCGAVTAKAPPPRPEPAGWYPDRYDALTDAERALCPLEPKRPGGGG